MVDFPTRLSFDELSSMFYLYFLSFKCTLIPPCGKLYADLNLFRSMGILFNSFLIFLLSRKVVLSSNIMVLIVSMDYISMLLFKNIFSGICLYILCAFLDRQGLGYFYQFVNFKNYKFFRKLHLLSCFLLTFYSVFLFLYQSIVSWILHRVHMGTLSCHP